MADPEQLRRTAIIMEPAITTPFVAARCEAPGGASSIQALPPGQTRCVGGRGGVSSSVRGAAGGERHDVIIIVLNGWAGERGLERPRGESGRCSRNPLDVITIIISSIVFRD